MTLFLPGSLAGSISGAFLRLCGCFPTRRQAQRDSLFSPPLPPSPLPRQRSRMRSLWEVAAHLLHAQLARPHIEWRWCLGAGQRHIVLAGQVQLPDDLRLQLPIALAAVTDALALPLLGAVTVLAHAKPVRCPPGMRRTQQGEAVSPVPLPVKAPQRPAWVVALPQASCHSKDRTGDFQQWPPQFLLEHSACLSARRFP